jgi:hypothetical protein
VTFVFQTIAAFRVSKPRENKTAIADDPVCPEIQNPSSVVSRKVGKSFTTETAEV